MSIPVILASNSPARLMLLKSQKISPIVIPPDVNEQEVSEKLNTKDVKKLVLELAKFKANYVQENNVSLNEGILIAADSMLEFENQILGKPHTSEEAIKRWQQMRGKTGILHTGHCLIRLDNLKKVAQVVSTKVNFAHIEDQEIIDYVATGEPLHVAGAFTIDSLGAAFIKQVEGDHKIGRAHV